MSLAQAVGAPKNCGTFVGPNAPSWVFEKPPIASSRFRLRTNVVPRILNAAGTTTVTFQDRVYNRYTNTLYITDYQVLIEYLVPNLNLNLTITSSNENVLLSPVNNVANGVTNGSEFLKATTPNGEFSIVELFVSEIQDGNTLDTFQNYVVNSAAGHASSAIDSRIVNKDATSKSMYSVQNPTGGIFIRNPDCWAADLDLTCFSPWNSTNGNRMAGTLISPRHVLFVEHFDFHPSVGSAIRFVTQNNTVITRTITALATHPDYVPLYPDITIGVLDADVPPSISFAKILPQNWRSYFPSITSGWGFPIPVIVMDQEKKALIWNWVGSDNFNNFSPPYESHRGEFWEYLVLGDSGSPAFLVINNQLVVLNLATYSSLVGTSLMPHKDVMNAMMTTLGGGYQVTEVDLSSFPVY